MDVILFLLLKVPSQYFKCHSMLSSLSPQHVIWVKIGLNDHQSSLIRGSENVSKGNVSPYSETVKEYRSRERVFPRHHEISVCVWWGEVGAVLQAELPVFISNSLF